jgi:hypothetical protein
MIPQSNLSSFKVLVFTVNASYLKRMNEGGGGEKGGRHLYTECFPLVLWGHFGKTEFFFYGEAKLVRKRNPIKKKKINISYPCCVSILFCV